jgi:hypothetical protein
MSKSKSCPVYSTIISFVLPKVTPEAKRALEASIKQTTLETDAFPRSGNFTAHNLDELARSSAKVEKRADSPGEFAFTYSTMQGRRVDDIIYIALLHGSSFVFPPTPRSDSKADGTPKMQTHEAQREKWINSLGFERKEIKKGDKVVGRRSLFGDAFEDLKAQLENEIPERFFGTEKPKSTKVLIPIVAPARLASITMRVNVYREDAGAEKILAQAKELSLLRLDGYTWPMKDDGSIENDLAARYEDEIVKIIEAQKQALTEQTKTEAAA